MKKALCAVLCLAMALSLFGCKMSISREINLREKLTSLMASDESLGIKGKYSSLEDIKDGSIDKDLVGTWKTSDGETSYQFNEDGTAVAKSTYGDSEVTYTCITANDYKVICESMNMESTDTDGNTTNSTVLSYATYEVDNDAFYFTVVEETTDENIDSAVFALVPMYRADDEGNIDESLAKNKIALDSFNGTWTCDKGEFTVADGQLKLNEDVFDISLNEKNQLVVDKDGTSTAYASAVSITKSYDDEDKTKSTEEYALALYYTGADENDKPNLLAVLDDWKTEYNWESYYYSGSFTFKE